MKKLLLLSVLAPALCCGMGPGKNPPNIQQSYAQAKTNGRQHGGFVPRGTLAPRILFPVANQQPTEYTAASSTQSNNS